LIDNEDQGQTQKEMDEAAKKDEVVPYLCLKSFLKMKLLHTMGIHMPIYITRLDKWLSVFTSQSTLLNKDKWLNYNWSKLRQAEIFTKK